MRALRHGARESAAWRLGVRPRRWHSSLSASRERRQRRIRFRGRSLCAWIYGWQGSPYSRNQQRWQTLSALHSYDGKALISNSLNLRAALRYRGCRKIDPKDISINAVVLKQKDVKFFCALLDRDKMVLFRRGSDYQVRENLSTNQFVGTSAATFNFCNFDRAQCCSSMWVSLKALRP